MRNSGKTAEKTGKTIGQIIKELIENHIAK
jgi:predicted DNA-binding protein